MIDLGSSVLSRLFLYDDLLHRQTIDMLVGLVNRDEKMFGNFVT